jgi:hypothetical protein
MERGGRHWDRGIGRLAAAAITGLANIRIGINTAIPPIEHLIPNASRTGSYLNYNNIHIDLARGGGAWPFKIHHIKS